MWKYFYCLPTSLYDVDKTSYLARSYSNTWTKVFLLLVFVNKAKVLVTMSFTGLYSVPYSSLPPLFKAGNVII